MLMMPPGNGYIKRNRGSTWLPLHEVVFDEFLDNRNRSKRLPLDLLDLDDMRLDDRICLKVAVNLENGQRAGHMDRHAAGDGSPDLQQLEVAFDGGAGVVVTADLDRSDRTVND